MGSVFLAIAMISAGVSDSADMPTLLPGVAQKGAIEATDTQTFRISLQADDAWLLEVEQHGLDLVVTVESPGNEPVDFNAPLLRLGTERILIEPARDGDQIVHIHSHEHTGASGHYVIRIRTLRQDEGDEELGLEALRWESEASSVYATGGKDAWNFAVRAYGSAASIWERLGNRSNEARAQFALARVLYWDMTDWPGAIASAKAAAELYSALGNESLYASTIHLQASALIEQATQIEKPALGTGIAPEAEALFEQALELLNEAAKIKARLGEHYEQARIINDIGYAYYYQGALDQASQFYRKAASIFQAEDEWSGELLPMANLSLIEYEKGHLSAALESYSRVLSLLPPDEVVLRAAVLSNMAIAYNALGQIDDALSSYFTALQLNESRGELKAQGNSLSGIGKTYYRAGNFDLALKYLERALPIQRRAQDGRGQGSTLESLGNIHFENGQYDLAIAAHEKAVTLATAPGERANAQVLLGRDLANAGRNETALGVLQDAVENAKASESPLARAQALLQRGKVLRVTQRLPEARADVEAALQVFRELGLLQGQAGARHELAQLARAEGLLNEAAQHADESLALIERLRAQIVNPELRAIYFGARQDYYHFYIDLLVSQYLQTDDVAMLYTALEVNERARNRAMVDLLTESAVDIRHGIEPELLARQDELFTQLAELRYRQAELVVKEPGSPALADVLADLQGAETELTLLETEIRQTNPEYANLTAPDALDARAIQASLDADSVLLQYAIGSPRSYLFVVTAESINMLVLPPRSDIENLALDIHEKLSTPALNPSVAAEREAAMQALSAMILEPAVPYLSQQRILLVLDAGLHYVPFAALPVIAGEEAAQRLLDSYEVVNLPSMSVVKAQRQLLGDRSGPSHAVAIFADPVFSRDDPRMSREDALQQPDTATIPTPFALAQALSRLPATSAEAQIVTELLPPEERFVATGFAANRQAVFDNELQEYRVVHFATHGLIDARYPALSSLALSSYDNRGHPTDGLIRLHDIFNIELNAEVVVLSACETALGRAVRGEGLIGLARGFIHAGSRSIVATLWQVPDRATAELMRRFYQGLLEDQLSVADALRQAQLSIAAEPRWRNPYFWAAFIVQGDWQ